ncbi:fatty acid synthase-like [Cydia amplana]|uniref:fatty acid synthase-like n=1 Tax=Cydia amplana TaxID=1869771 RepID=UPI002FE623B8
MPSVVNGHADSEVVLTGLSGRLPESDNIDEFARNLFEGVDMVTDDDRRWTPGMHGLPSRLGKLKDLKHFDAAYFNLFDKQADVMDPGMRILLEVTHETIVDAGYNPIELRGTRTGVYVGVGRLETYEAWGALYNKSNGYTMTGGLGCMFSNRVAYSFDLKGPSLVIDVACSSSIFALAQAVNDIKVGRCDAAIVAGVNICLDPSTSLNFFNLNMLAKDGRCAAFDESGQGYVRSEAVVAVFLQRRSVARRVYCTVHAARVNNDGHKPQGITYPSGEMQRRIAKETYDETGLRPQDVAYFEAHGTGTKAGDPQELNAIVEQFCKNRESPLPMGSVKSNMGHAEWASGLCSIAKVVIAMERGEIPGNLHYENPNTDIPALSDGRIQVVDRNTSWQGGVVSVNSSGFGGANAHVILEGGRGDRPLPTHYAAPRLILASGRTDDAVEKLLKLATENPQDGELHALIDAVHAHAIPNHPRRGYAILSAAAPVIEVLDSAEQRPIWFAFSGMGTQWAGMARDLLRLPVFASSIERSAAALKPYMDLKHVISEASPEEFRSLIINFAVSIVAVQVALVDVLSELGIHPDGMIGHSLGETACGYMDGTLTTEQTVMAAYWRARCTLEAELPLGAMAAVGLSWEETAKRCPEDIDLACHNGPESVTISGPKAAVEKFVQQLAADDVFVRMVDSSGVAFHSRSVASVAPQLRERLQEIIPHPKPRSALWLSSSIPEDKWDSDLARFSGADYIVNNQLSPVRFASVLKLVPPRAILVEIAPHALLQAVLKRALPEAVHVPLVRKEAPDALVHLLAAVGKIYAAGAQPQVSRLYPPISWPVSRGTPGLASHISWDHSIEWSVVDPTTAARTGENVIEYDLTKPEEEFIAGHNIEGRVLFPATGYLTLIWRTIAKMNNQDIEQSAVVLENLNIRRATIMSREAPVRFLVSLLDGTGEFQISEGGEVVVTGTARITANASAERLSASALAEAEDQEVSQEPSLDPEDIYKDLRLRGYKYKGIFQGIKSSDARGLKGLLNWEGNWISFMDTALQFGLIGADTHDLYLPSRIERVVIDPAAQCKEAALATNGALPVKRYPSIGVIVAGGVEFRGLITTLAPRSINIQAPPKLEKFVFIPFNGVFEDKRQALTAAVQLVIENFGVQQFKIAEVALKRPVEALLLPQAVQDFQGEPAMRVSATLAAGIDAPDYSTVMNSLGVKVSDRKVADGGLEKECHLVMGADVLSQPELLSALAAASLGFVLLEEQVDLFDKWDKAMVEKGLTLVSRTRTGSREYILLRRTTTLPSTRIILEARDDDFQWVDQLKDAMKRVQTEHLRVYVWSREHGSGVLGLGTCLRREPGGDKIRFYYIPGAQDVFNPDEQVYKAQVEKDLTFNVLKDGVWGTFRHLPLDDIAGARKQVEHAYVDAITRGDLSSLRWIESDLRHAAFTPLRPRTDLCSVYYASLNFRDVMNATGKLTAMATIGTEAKMENSIIGLEFSGLSSTGKRVMGIVTRGLATSVMADTGFLWEVPKHWSLEEAATVPIAYATAYYALVVRGHMRRGEAVLIHAGAGGVGQAAITVALNAGCTIFTTVGSPAKRAFLRERFPQLLNTNIGNSRDCSFEQLVQIRTHGRGVDLVLNSLAGDQLQASLRCLGERGRFLEIGKVDLIANSVLGLSLLLKNTSVQGILLDALFPLPADDLEKVKVVQSVAEGIAAGVVRPLPATAYGEDQLEQAFRYMATGKHIGKVLIRVRDEEATVEQSSRLMPALPRTYMHPGKSYVLVGGLGGFGLELGDWLVRRGARTLVFCSRSGVRTGYQALCIRR